MFAIHTKYLPPTNSQGARIKAYTAAWGNRKGYEITINYPYEGSGHLCHFQAVIKLLEKYKPEWASEGMCYGDSADGRGYCFCFDDSKV